MLLAGSIGRDFSWVELTLSAVVAQAASQSRVVAGSQWIFHQPGSKREAEQRSLFKESVTVTVREP